MGYLFPARVDAIVVEIGAFIPIILFVVAAARWAVRKFSEAVDERIEPIHRRIDEHMDEEERSLAAHDEHLAWLTGTMQAIGGSLGVPLAPPPSRPTAHR